MNTPQDRAILIPPDADGMRLDVFLLGVIGSGATRSIIQRSIRDGAVTIDEKGTTKPSSTVHEGQTVRFNTGAFAPPMPPGIRPNTSIRFRILHEDPQLIVVDKPPGIPVHSGDRNEHPTIVDALIVRYPDLAAVGEDPLRPGIVHRLDQDTSGVLLVARTQEMFFHLKQLFMKRKVRKTYLALVRGVIKEQDGSIKKPIARNPRNPLRQIVVRKGEGREAETFYFVRERFDRHTLLEVRPITGRMHQIRVHLAHLGFPIAGDSLYGKQKRTDRIPGLNRQFLHAESVAISMPDGKKRRFESPIPDDLAAALDGLRKDHASPDRQDNPTYRVPSRNRNSRKH